MSKKPYYVLNDSMLEFYFRYVNRATSLINAEKGSLYYQSEVKEHIHDFMGKIFEKKYLPESNPLVCIFSLCDFSSYVKDNAKNCKLIGIDDMYRKGSSSS